MPLLIIGADPISSLLAPRNSGWIKTVLVRVALFFAVNMEMVKSVCCILVQDLMVDILTGVVFCNRVIQLTIYFFLKCGHLLP